MKLYNVCPFSYLIYLGPKQCFVFKILKHIYFENGKITWLSLFSSNTSISFKICCQQKDLLVVPKQKSICIFSSWLFQRQAFSKQSRIEEFLFAETMRTFNGFASRNFICLLLFLIFARKLPRHQRCCIFFLVDGFKPKKKSCWKVLDGME